MRRLLAAGAVALAAATAPAEAGKRVALVIGNAAYQNVPSLPNARNDAQAVAAALTAARFDVVMPAYDLGVTALRRTVGDFAETARDADIAVLYYAGHGMEVDGVNWLIPVDARLARDFDVEDEAFSLERVVKAIDSARQLRLVILDACRDNPFLRTMKRSVASRSIGRGLAQVEPAVADTLIAFSAKAGSVALDGDGTNSPYTTALVRHLTTPGLDIRIAFGRVRDDVLQTTGRKQEPFVYGSLGGRTIALVEPPPKPVATAVPPAARGTAAVPLKEGLQALLAQGLPAWPQSRRDAVVVEFAARKLPRALALAPGKGTWTKGTFADKARMADDTLEACQLFHGRPCALLAVDDRVVADASGNWRLQDMARVRYAGTFDPERVPVSSGFVARDPNVAAYAAAAGPKAIVIHPWGAYFIEFGHPDQMAAETRAFARCEADPRRNGRDPPCYLYAVGNQVVLPKRISKPTG